MNPGKHQANRDFLWNLAVLACSGMDIHERELVKALCRDQGLEEGTLELCGLQDCTMFVLQRAAAPGFLAGTFHRRFSPAPASAPAGLGLAAPSHRRGCSAIVSWRSCAACSAEAVPLVWWRSCAGCSAGRELVTAGVSLVQRTGRTQLQQRQGMCTGSRSVWYIRDKASRPAWPAR